ncbi:type II toxin-antitoxin system VapB family antitoxin [Kytococcus sedentarius]|uniref:type II toxin-antitoxin system VapB family antitoxin n=1 Tax=Kytococcus sedentarius TaxID=1276 RepID=UPI00387A6782
MNIKNERVHALARRAAQMEGMSQTSVLERALEEFLARHEREGGGEDREARATQLVTQIRDGLDLPSGGTLADDLADLYDAEGLPR